MGKGRTLKEAELEISRLTKQLAESELKRQIAELGKEAADYVVEGEITSTWEDDVTQYWDVYSLTTDFLSNVLSRIGEDRKVRIAIWKVKNQ